MRPYSADLRERIVAAVDLWVTQNKSLGNMSPKDWVANQAVKYVQNIDNTCPADNAEPDIITEGSWEGRGKS
jgi:hypothetical protein